MIIINIVLVLLGLTIPLGIAIFWSKTAKILNRRFENKSCGTILDGNRSYILVKWLYHHRSKFNILMVAIVTIIEISCAVTILDYSNHLDQKLDSTF